MRSSFRFILFGLTAAAGLLLIASCRSSESDEPSTSTATGKSADVVASNTADASSQSVYDGSSAASSEAVDIDSASAGSNASSDSPLRTDTTTAAEKVTNPASEDATERAPDHSVRPDTADLDCPVDPGTNLYAMVRDSTGIDFQSDPKVAPDPDPPTSGNWINQDINDDGRTDIGIREGLGSVYEHSYELYANCGEGWYVRVFSEDTREVRLADPDSTVHPDSPASIPARYAETKSGQRWRQLIYITPGSRRINSKRRVYRMYDNLNRYAMVPGSAWFVGETPYSKSEMQQAGGPHPDCPAGDEPPRIINSVEKEKKIWKGDINKDGIEDIVYKSKKVRERKYYIFEVYVGCEGKWYSRVFGGGATEIKIEKDNEKVSRWNNIKIKRFYKSNKISYKAKFKRLKYEKIE